MAALQAPKILLLDEHTAALDPATAAKVLELSDQIIREHKLTAMMITHNMTDAIRHGNRLIMMDRGRIVLDIAGEEKMRLTKADLLARFAEKAGVQEIDTCPDCTKCQPERFWSHRVTGGNRGSQAAIIRLKGGAPA